MISISYIVLRCADIEASRAFYEKLGLSFKKERHGKGFEHYSAYAGGCVLELYPGSGTSGLRLGLMIPSGIRGLYVDPDGHHIDVQGLA